MRNSARAGVLACALAAAAPRLPVDVQAAQSAAPSSAAGLPWAQAIVRTTALTVATLPVTLLALMGVRYFDAPLFVLGAASVIAAAATLLVAAFSRSRGKNSATGPDATDA